MKSGITVEISIYICCVFLPVGGTKMCIETFSFFARETVVGTRAEEKQPIVDRFISTLNNVTQKSPLNMFYIRNYLIQSIFLKYPSLFNNNKLI